MLEKIPKTYIFMEIIIFLSIQDNVLFIITMLYLFNYTIFHQHLVYEILRTLPKILLAFKISLCKLN